ncbi:pyruvate synthase subunit beta [Clostridiaceae bacterium UIB06]|uniref:Pyruvate synthase subunit beta n=1 Tax=Clostridium thailandense TaxID=2794346 RepID=A0A949TXI0_9CLOT|nr:thiamine pyrophosphate-dependent enzyme [Clostridium thailandense]MBV7273676.1 pyruvate synthase subunit beta [Clostridium thailandense]MCH5137068.1 pyruvate synthase subunit beta [Clostridiaceae bacterium UIB06]
MHEIKHNSKGLIPHGVSACAGCGMELIIRNVLDVLGEDTIIIIPPGCSALFSGYGNETAIKIPGYQGNLENTAAGAAGVRAALNAMGNTHTTVVGFAGDGGTVDIGLQALSGVLERGDKVLYICYDNEAYMNTGIQGSSSTPFLASTTTTPAGKPTGRKDLMQIAIAHDIPYAATASIHNLTDLKKKVQKAKDTDGPSLLHIHTPCPTGWRYNPAKTIELARAAVQTGCWVLFEYENGKITINSKPKELKPVEEYIKPQGRFKGLSAEQREELQKYTTEHYEKYIKRLESMV